MLSRLKFDLSDIIKQKLNYIPNYIWESKTTTFCDQQMAGGQYIKEIVNRLRKFGHSDKNIKSRVFGFSENEFYLSVIQGDSSLIGTFDVYNENINMKFDVIVGNYPYERSVGPSKTEPIWHLFAEKAFKLLKEGGYLSVIHPSAWRSSKGKFTFLKDIYLSRKVLSLDLNDFNKGREVFGAGTNFDIVTLENIPYENGFKTKIIDDKDNIEYMDLGNIPFLPNSNFEKILSLVAKEDEESINIMYSSSAYEIRNNYMSDIKDIDYKYPCIYSITKRDGINLRYSNQNKGHFGIPKVIWTNGLGTYPIVDKDGEYGLTQFAYAISDKVENLDNIKKALESDEFFNLMKSIRFTNNIYDYKIISTFKKDFWKEFIDE